MTTWQAGLVGSRAFLNARQTHNLTADVEVADAVALTRRTKSVPVVGPLLILTVPVQ